MRASVQADMAKRMDTGVHVNPALANLFGVGSDSSALEPSSDPMAPQVPPRRSEPPPPIEPLDNLRDLSGDAMTTKEASIAERRRRASGDRGPQIHFPQCSLSAARNLLRDEMLPRSFLAERQIGQAVGALDVGGGQGSEGDIRFPCWRAILHPLVEPGEVLVAFDPQAVGASELLHDARLMACAYVETTHVIALFRHDSLVNGRVGFRKYDNDSDARLRGTYELTSARRLWRPCDMYAITQEGSALYKAAKEQPLARTQTRAQRRAVTLAQVAVRERPAR